MEVIVIVVVVVVVVVIVGVTAEQYKQLVHVLSAAGKGT